MKLLNRTIMALGLLVLAACSTSPSVQPVDGGPSTWSLADTTVRFGPEIGRTETGEEFNSNFVWQGDGGGNRKRQVVSMFDEAMQVIGRDVMRGNRRVRMAVTVNYFHALNNWARLFCCGAHRIRADLQVTDIQTGEVLADGKDVSLGRLALGGVPGLVAVAAGRDQRVRIVEGIARRTREWLSNF